MIRPNILVDGENSPEEWNNLKIADGQGLIKDLHAYKDTEKLYIMVQGESLDGQYNNIYLNTDNNTSTGYKNWGQYGENGAGADYLLQIDEAGIWNLFKYIGPDWNWEEANASIGAAVKDKDGLQCLELSMDLSSFDSANKNMYLSMGLNNDTGFAPIIWAAIPYAKVIDLVGYSIQVDGMINDWKTVASKIEADTTELQLLVVQDIESYIQS